jgi:hypothetical protein
VTAFVELGLKGGEVWKLTPLQYDALCKRSRKMLSIQDSFTARLYMLLANMFRDEKARPNPFTMREMMVFPPEDEDEEVTQTGLTVEEALKASSGLKQSWKSYTDSKVEMKEASRGRVPRSKSS